MENQLSVVLPILVSLLTLLVTVIGWRVVHNYQKQQMELKNKLEMEKESKKTLSEKKLASYEKMFESQKEGVREIGVWADEVIKLRNQRIFLFESVKSHIKQTDEGAVSLDGPDPEVVKEIDSKMSVLLTPYIMKFHYGYRYAEFFFDRKRAEIVENAIKGFVNATFLPRSEFPEGVNYSDQAIERGDIHYKTISDWVMEVMRRDPYEKID